MNPEQSHSSNPHSQITGLILAGGQGRRMGRVDKGLQLLQGQRMVDHVYQRLSPQVGGIVISANQNQDAYRSFGVRVVSDIVSAAPAMIVAPGRWPDCMPGCQCPNARCC